MAMTMNDYREEVKTDLLAYAREYLEYDKEATAEKIMDDAWTADNVTGNGSGSYTFNAYEAQQNLTDLIWDEELLDLFREFGYERVPMEEGAETIDVSIRCFLLHEFTADVEALVEELGNNEE